MLRKQAVLAYAFAAGSALGSVICTILALRQPWFRFKSYEIYLTKSCTGYSCEAFPAPEVCLENPGFCAAWKTAVFGLALTITIDITVALAVLFSWVAARRKKTTVAVKVLSAISVGIDTCVLTTMITLRHNYLAIWKWIPSGGISKLLASTLCLLFIYVEMFFFRDIIKRDDEEDIDSDYEDEDEDIDSISVDETLGEEDRDFYIFTKQARRQAMRSG